MSQPRILVIGEALIDRYWLGTATRLSPEAPVPVVKIEKKFDIVGGATNVARNLDALGAKVEGIYQRSGCPIKNRLLIGNTQVARWDERDSCEQIYVGLEKLYGIDGVVLSDYGKGGFRSTETLRESLRNFKGKIFIDTKQSPSVFGGLEATFFPNLKEFQKFQGYYQYLDPKYYVLKKSALGLQFEGYTWPSKARNIVSVSGAGDTVIAAWAFAILTGKPEPWAAEFAIDAAGVVCAKPFTATATLAEIERFHNDH